jgi:hypothetical protein
MMIAYAEADDKRRHKLAGNKGNPCPFDISRADGDDSLIVRGSHTFRM